VFTRQLRALSRNVDRDVSTGLIAEFAGCSRVRLRRKHPTKHHHTTHTNPHAQTPLTNTPTPRTPHHKHTTNNPHTNSEGSRTPPHTPTQQHGGHISCPANGRVPACQGHSGDRRPWDRRDPCSVSFHDRPRITPLDFGESRGGLGPWGALGELGHAAPRKSARCRGHLARRGGPFASAIM
jgi:hypothetical protein